ncbi:MAG: efflux RND transporter periplasmic adaptor subunit [Gillisia sp.]
MRIIKIGMSLISLLVLASCNNEQEITPYRGKVKYETISVSSKLAGRINKLYVTEGDEVQKGDTLAFLDIPEINAKMIQADGAMKAARGQLNMAHVGATEEQLIQIDGQLDAAKAELQFARESYSRLDNMYRDSLVTRQQLDEVNMKLQMARAQVAALEARRVEAGKSVRIEQLDQVQGQLDRARGAREEVLVASGEMYLVAPADMTIETISLREGELLSPGYALFNGFKKNSLYFRFTINESKIYEFKKGSELLMINPYTNEEITGRIATIKQLAKYAEITNTAPLYDLSESVYELKVIPISKISENSFYSNATILLKE